MNLYGIGNSLSQAYGMVAELGPSRQSYGLNGLSRTGASGAVTSSDARLRLPSSASVRLSDSGRLQSALADLKRSSADLNSADKVAAPKASSDNKAISASISQPELAPKSATLAVSQLAQTQRLQSQTFADRDSSIVGTGSLRIEFGRFNSTNNSFTPTGTAQTVSISASNGTLAGIANAINRAGVGLDAAVVEDGSNFRLALSGKQSGSEQAFRLSVSDADGNNRDSSQGLSRLAFDPAELPSTGRNLEQTRAAQDAQLTVDGKSVQSGSNQVGNAIAGVTLNIEASGSARIDIRRDASQASRSANSLVEAVNRFDTQTNSAQGDGLSRRVGSDLARALSAAESGSGKDRLTLEQVGVARGSNGQLAVDEDKFRRAFEANPDGVSSLLGNAASRLESTSMTALNSNSLRGGSDNSSLNSRGGDNPYVAQARLQQFQSRFAQQPTLLSYSPTTRNLYGLSQYLSIAGL